MEKALSTFAAHAGRPTAATDYRPICTPVHNAVTYTYGDMGVLDAVFAGERSGYVYSRFGNPTVTALEEAIAQLEAEEAAIACASGMAALHLALLGAGATAGSTILTSRDLYGGTHALLNTVLVRQGVRVRAVEMTNLPAVEAAIGESKPTLLLIETISNPLLRVADIPSLVKLAHTAGAGVIVDNTFATPCLYRPILHGADYVVHSATKYLGGHGDTLGGVIVSSRQRCLAIRELQKLIGDVLGPNEAWLIVRGIKTLPLRMRQQCQNADLVARFLSEHRSVDKVFYPGLPTHPDFALCRRLFPANYGGAMVAFEIRGAAQEQVFGFMDALKLVVPATSLGDVCSLALYPTHSSHRAFSDEERQQLGIRPNLVRLSVGIEEAADIIADLEQALAAIGSG
ncbi:MAG: PLP-dependent transferase [Chloroflexi bacterium]|nr:PLP-dependent transferase [Chloroflexota bacterium]